MEDIFSEKKLYAAVTAFYALSLPEYHMPVHSHTSCELMYVTDGVCTVFCDGTEISLKQNQFIFIDSAVPHQLEIAAGHPCSILNLEFTVHTEKTPLPMQQLLEESAEFRKFWASRPPFAVSDDQRSMGYSMKDLLSRLQKQPEQPDFLFRLLFYRMLLEMTWCFRRRRSASGLEYLKKACDYIDRHLLEELSIPAIAACAGVNKSYLQALFSRTMHCTIGSYINQKRLNQAVFLLTNSSLSVTDVAFASGYNSRQHFAHTFQKFYGISPSHYRRLHSRQLLPDTGNSRYRIDTDGARQEPMIK
ncbi:transcriptional regulator, AraC family [Marvinbryantia formatexigens DSM 14469]|uniref:Transcriptional regulator, AraC family n=1 Tax=Marvinbryantia formatexigens DSM 14469 TaxID=478749 RepID=C6LAW9_9FIRM|nr:AraC family transcriptional regulator [Marvinbryantia formatexigens]EET62100.1 transcriptional regulator, AraC family [Marvinbryantia formatexigens DSM 14469]UWO26543.1 AraC family transcriptional regulator [Marvinbryantia formatexigens DSM 14469]SDF76669.1 AraC-type DNA-binding protein [Marvinbryantia formatexigens]